MLLVFLMNTPVHAAVGGTVHLFGKVMTAATPNATSGDGSPYSTTGLKLFQPRDMWINTVANVMYVTETTGNRVRAIPLDGTSPVSTLVGDLLANTARTATTAVPLIGPFASTKFNSAQSFAHGRNTYPIVYVGDNKNFFACVVCCSKNNIQRGDVKEGL